MSGEIRNIIFDWSGTLVDDLPAVLQATNYAFRQAAVPELTLEQFRAEFCLPFKAFYDRYAPHVPLPRLEEWFHAEFRRAQASVAELPHAREFLEFCHRRQRRLFVLSSIHPDHYAVQSAQTGFGAFIQQAYVAVRDKRTQIHEVLAEHRLTAGETMFIGDMEHDMETARGAEVYACGVLTGYNTLAQLRASHPDLIVEHLGELRGWLESRAFVADGRSAGPAAVPRPGAAGLLPVPTVGALIFNPAGEVLMIRTQKWSNLWGIPGGKIKSGERAVDALVRELKEETNLDVTGIEFVMVQDCIGSPEFYREAHFLLLNYTCHCGGQPAVRLNAEAQAFQWVPLAGALNLPLNQPTRVLIEAVVHRDRSLHRASPQGMAPSTASC